MIGSDRDDARADREFAREQRIEVYGDFLGSTDKAMKSIQPFPPGPPEGEDALATNLTPPTTEQLNEPFPVAGDPQVRSDTPTAAR
jgi:hypothetical protein